MQTPYISRYLPISLYLACDADAEALQDIADHVRDRRAHHEQVVLGLAPSPVATRPLSPVPVPVPVPPPARVLLVVAVAVAVRLVRVRARVRGQGLGSGVRVSVAALASAFSRYMEI